MSNLVFITGSSGVGTTPLVGILKSILSDNFEVYDLDERLSEVYKNQPNWLEKWRNEATRYFVGRAVYNIKESKSTIVCGLTWPHEVMASENIGLVPSVKFCFLDVDDEILKGRFYQRRFSDEYKIAALKKETGLTPEEFIENNRQEMELLKKECVEYGARIIDTTILDSGMVADEIRDWLSN